MKPFLGRELASLTRSMEETSCISPSPAAAQCENGTVPRRYPLRFRVSAVRNPVKDKRLGNESSRKRKQREGTVVEELEVFKSSAVDCGAVQIQSLGNKSSLKSTCKEEVQNENAEVVKPIMVDRAAVQVKCLGNQNLVKSTWKEKVENKKEEVAETNVVNLQAVNAEAVTRNKVREKLRAFQMIYRELLQQQKSKCKEPGHGKQVVLQAFWGFKEKNSGLDDRKYLGSVPGVEVGDEFHFRAECYITCLHKQMRGILDFMQHEGRDVAVSVVHYGSFSSLVKDSDRLIFRGTGVSSEHQKLIHGNLALKNCIATKTPVRVIKGIKGCHAVGEKSKKVVKYVYDGLYSVEKCMRKREENGYYAFFFQLQRLPGQAKLEIKKVKNLIGWSRALSGLCVEDISHGEEKLPVSVVNTIDDEQLGPFRYSTKMIYPSSFHPSPPRGCDCVNGCSDSVKCACAVKNGGEIPFNYSGAIVEAKPLVYECGPSCKCPPTCHNRVSQHGIKFPLEIFKTKTMGWGVRSLISIPSGSFICEYVGELLDDEEAEKRSTDEYLFEIGKNYYDESLWEGLSTSIPDLQKNASCEVAEDEGFTVDASVYGNVGRFINHHCTPNTYAQNLLYDHDDKSKPHIMLFAAENIPPLQELTYHYNYIIDEITDSNGNIKKKNCYCGSVECTGRLY